MNQSPKKNFIYVYATYDGMVKVGFSSGSVQVHLFMSSNIIATYAYFEFKDDFQYLKQLERIIHKKLQALLPDHSMTAKCEMFKRYAIEEEQSKDKWGEIYETIKAEIRTSQRCIGWCPLSEMCNVGEMP